MRNFYKIMAAAALLAACTAPALADDITADVLTYNGKSKVVTATGNVVMHANQGAEITAKYGEYHFDDRSGYLDGGVKYVKEQTTLTGQKMFMYKDKTMRGIGNVYYHDGAEGRTLKGDDVMYNNDTGFAKIEGNGYLEDPNGSVAAPHIEGNLKQIKVVATGGVNLTSTANNAIGYGDHAVYTRTGKDGTDGKLVLTGNAWINQNGNTFNGPELILRDADQIAETTGRSTIVIINDGSQPDDQTSSDSGSSTPGEPPKPVTATTPIAGRPEEAGKPLDIDQK